MGQQHNCQSTDNQRYGVLLMSHSTHMANSGGTVDTAKQVFAPTKFYTGRLHSTKVYIK